MGLAIIAVILILIFASWWSSTPDIKTKGNPNFHQESFDKDSWKNFDIHHDSDNHVIPEDYLEGKYFNGDFIKKKENKKKK
ncbi:MAG: hypothetical protein SPJ42_01990 [Oscillospiraceae bacterium]|nr:hypothetical protein [Clostridiaceae bacterium]MDY5947996.1 hypothetical protein [Oscillospiraceae bacterium]